MSETSFYIEYLKKEFENRKATNPKYSLRLYAKELGLDPSSLSSILRGIRPFPWRRARAVAAKLHIDEENSQKFIFSVHNEVSDLDIKHGSSDAKILDIKQYSKMIEEWEYYAILTYFETKNARTDLEYLAQKFQLSQSRVTEVVNELLKNGFLTKVENGQIVRATVPVKTPEDVPSESLQKAHLQEMELVKKQMSELEPMLRDISSITFAGDPDKVSQAKKLIRSFRLKMNRLMENDKANEVYLLAIQLVPLTLNQPSLQNERK